MELEKKYFEGINADDDINLLKETDYINAENFRIGTTDVGSTMRLESIGGTAQLDVQPPAASQAYTPLCGVEDEERRRIIYFLFYSAGTHQIRCHDRKTGLNYLVLDQSKADLNFSKNSLVQAKTYGDLLIYTDDNQEIKIINIEAGIKMNHPTYVTDVKPYIIDVNNTKLLHEDITLLRRPPLYAPDVVKVVAANPLTDSNFTKEQAFQFAYRYFYRDYQYSVVGTWSKLVNYNTAQENTDNWNHINTFMPLSEKIPQTVQLVELLVKDMNTDGVQVMRTWDKDITTDATAIDKHNFNAEQLYYAFYNNKSGIVVAPAEAAKTEENIPRQCKTLDTARKRLFLANYLEGFNSPTATSLAVAQVASTSSPTITAHPVLLWHGKYYKFSPPSGEIRFHSAYVVYLASVPVPGYYYLIGTEAQSIVDYPVLGVATTPLDFTPAAGQLLFIGATENLVDQYFQDIGYGITEHSFTYSGHNTTINNVPVAVTQVYKSNSPYQAGVAFYDRLKRRIGMVTKESLIQNIPDRKYTASTFVTALAWTLPTGTQLEIPPEAYYYSIVRTLNLRTRYFVQTFVDDCRYAKKDENGVIIISPASASPTAQGYVAIDTQSLIKDGMGYVYNELDFARIYYWDGTTEWTPVTLKVVGVYGRYALCEFYSFNTFLTASKMVVEFFRLHKPSESEPFYEVGNMYAVKNAGTAAREYGTQSGILPGDVYVLERTSFLATVYRAEAMSSNDKFWQSWWTDASKEYPNIKGKQIRKLYSIAFSNLYVIGTQFNGLSSFETLDTEDISPESGAIQKLLLTSKVQEDGTVMLVICYAETLTMYLGEAQISDASSTAFFVKSEGVIGSINALRGSFGTQNAESVILHRGQAYWFDAANGAFVRYDVNGLFPISDYKMRRAAKLIGETYLSLTQSDIEILGGRPFIFGGIDPHHNEVLWAIPKLGIPPKGYLGDYALSYIAAIGKVTITSVGDDNDKIEVFVQDPDFGKISLGFYLKKATDTTVTILATSIKNVLALNPYGYVVTNVAGVISIAAKPGVGEIMNIGNRLGVQITPGGAVITWIGKDAFCLTDVSGNTGSKRYLNRERVVNAVPSGYIEPNAAGADFVADAVDTTLCPIPIPATNFLMINITDRVLVNSVDKVKI